jgi:uncharacterized protein
MSGALAIFVKTPGHSPVKSRLAAQRGERYAVTWYRHAAAAVASVARQAVQRYGLTAYWAVAEADALDAWTDLPALAQGSGGLGERMARVQAELVRRHGFGLLLGADAPQLEADALHDAIGWLDASSPRLALGPAHDGGFWLFGSNLAPPLPRWTAVGYSVADTARQLQRVMHDLGAWRTLPALTDADHVEDLATVEAALHALARPTPAQQGLADWMSAQREVSA